MKCDKRFPCAQCVKYGTQERCGPEVVDLSTRWTKSRDEVAFLRWLQSTLGGPPQTSTKDALALVEQRLNVLQTGHPAPVDTASSIGAMTEARGVEFKDILNDHNDEAFETAMALMRLGRGYPDVATPPPDSVLNG